MATSMFVLWVLIAASLLPKRKGLVLGVDWTGIIGPVVTGTVVQSAGINETLGFDYSILFISILLITF
ncbi:hypothetical protein NGI46_22155 [Peribacillus butanolivorans]|uniref:hypothetical protein n=1 Tax=Peribacillus butanolivorans TaxID=421767 RepID=UPI00207C7A56|nr:hypothetical protein [Peribacillus butanolivorans]MCO0600080.1 hypothetical protein [Peribacillus butanolivorans]